ncbi:MAG: phosphoenolpyruvate carboxykinase [Firmicutes bacterium]|nr:phosphoenolpyruvate carboxykinase [Bacillota bacterium]
MSLNGLIWAPRQVILNTGGQVCDTVKELLASKPFYEVVEHFLRHLQKHESPLLELFDAAQPRQTEQQPKGTEGTEQPPKGTEQQPANPDRQIDVLVALFQALAVFPLQQAARIVPGAERFAARPKLLHRFVEELYDYWRGFDRFVVSHAESQANGQPDARPYRTFNDTVERLTDLVRAAYRDICENITGDHPRVYRQVAAGAHTGIIAVPKEWVCPGGIYEPLRRIPFIRQLLINPPLIIDPPMNKRTGEFTRVEENPLEGWELRPEEWLCYPALVGPLVIFVYFHQRFMGLGCSLANLFELAGDAQIAQGPHAIYLFGAPAQPMQRFGQLPTVFHEDHEHGWLVAAVPGEDRFGYFGYLKKMVLTLHNVIMMQRFGRMPFHGAMTRIVLRSGVGRNIVLIGDTGAGKSESLEALRILGEQYIGELRVIADDMGSLAIDASGAIRGYGTEIGAFVRLDDLQPGYAFSQIDRAIIMSPQKTNARAVLPVTTLDEVLHGYPVDYLLYANNYEEVDESHPILERFADVQSALAVFREGKAMSKGTTTSTGVVTNYFANVFGPVQYPELHEKLAQQVFTAAFARGVFVGQLRTRLGIPGYESKGPEMAARALLAQMAAQQARVQPSAEAQPQA